VVSPVRGVWVGISREFHTIPGATFRPVSGRGVQSRSARQTSLGKLRRRPTSGFNSLAPLIFIFRISSFPTCLLPGNPIHIPVASQDGGGNLIPDQAGASSLAP